MATYYVDDGGDGTNNGDSWAHAYTSLSALDDAKTLASGDIIYIGHDHVCQAVHAAARTITGPSFGAPCSIISATQGSNPPTYQASTTKQVDTTEGAYDLKFDGSFALYGLCMSAGRDFILDPDHNEAFQAYDCVFKPAAGRSVTLMDSLYGEMELVRCTIDLAADVSAQTAAIVIFLFEGTIRLIGLTLANASFRTGTVFSDPNFSMSSIDISGCDFTALATSGTVCEIFPADITPYVYVNNCSKNAYNTWTVSGTPDYTCFRLMVTNSGAADDPVQLYVRDFRGELVSSSTVYRTGGATVEGATVAWWVSTPFTSQCAEGMPFRTPWQYGLASSTGSKTFDVYTTNDTGDFTDAQVWLEVEYLATSDIAKWTLASDQRTITTTAAAQDDDTTSTWTGGAAGFDTYKQRLRVTATIGETGQFRWRVCVGLVGIATTRDFYIDPKCTVT